ncbi:serine--tRNA ligase [Caldiplasma sukawensis]
MIDIKDLRENPELFRETMKKRFMNPELVDQFLELDSEWRNKTSKVNGLRSERNKVSAIIGKADLDENETEELKSKVREINEEIKIIQNELREIEDKRNKIVSNIPNLLYEDVPIAKGDENNLFVSFSGEARVRKEDLENFLKLTNNKGKYRIVEKTYSHSDIIEKHDLVDMERAAKIAGARFYITKNRLLKLELALINYAVDFLSERGFSVVEPPPMITGEYVWKATDEGTFQDAIYRIDGEDLYLISTSEHPIAAMLSDEYIEEKELPIRVGGFSPCFRKEAGSHGKDTKGIFRVHYFKKVEQFIFCRQEDSWDFLEELRENTEKLFSSLGFAYRVVNVCSGELGSLAAKKYDIEVWMPNQGTFRELASISNDTDYQARSLNIKYNGPDGRKFVHTLNGTAIPTSRTLAAIIENFYENDEIKIPKVLVPYTGFDTIK